MSIRKLRKEISSLFEQADATRKREVKENLNSALIANRIERGLRSMYTVCGFTIINVAVNEWVNSNPDKLRSISIVSEEGIVEKAIQSGANFSVAVELLPNGFIIPRVLNIGLFNKVADNLVSATAHIGMRSCTFSGMLYTEFEYLDSLTTYIGSSRKDNSFMLLLFFKLEE